MGGKPVIVAATVEHCHDMAGRMKEQDAAEVMASCGHTPLEALLYSLERSSTAFAMEVDGRTVAMSGVAPVSILGGVGSPWMLGTDEVDKHAIMFLRQSKKLVREMLGTYTMLVNYVDERHDVSKRWLQWLGFKLEEAEPFGVSGLPFHKFTMGNK